MALIIFSSIVHSYIELVKYTHYFTLVWQQETADVIIC